MLLSETIQTFAELFQAFCILKYGIAMLCLRSPLSMSCVHKIHISFNSHMFIWSRFPYCCCSHFLWMLEKGENTFSLYKVAESTEGKKNRVLGVPLVRPMSCRLRKVGSWWRVSVVFTAGNKLGKICNAVQRKKVRQNWKIRPDSCNARHSNKFVEGCIRVVYKATGRCGHFYLRQTGCCLDQRSNEHKWSFTGDMPSINFQCTFENVNVFPFFYVV